MQNIIGLNKLIESESTGTVPAYHVLVRYWVDLPNQIAGATFGCFMTANAKVPVATVDVQLKGTPEGAQAIYAAVLAMADGPLAGAAPVHAAEDLAPPDAPAGATA